MFFVLLFCLLALLAAWVSLPLFPAVFIYRRFPNAPLAANGLLAGLTINAGGAFAAYLIVLLVIAPLVFYVRDQIHEEMRPYWEISGEVVLVDETGKQIRVLNQVLDQMDVRTRNPNILGHDGTTLSFKLPEATDDRRLPSSIEISFPNSNYEGHVRIPLEQQTSPWHWWMFWKRWEVTATDITENWDNYHKKINVGTIIIKPVTGTEVYKSTQGMDPPRETAAR